VELGASDYLGKPYRYGWLLSTVKGILKSSSHEHASDRFSPLIVVPFFVNFPTEF
jgi:DNA-binding response OmpR family regulator